VKKFEKIILSNFSNNLAQSTCGTLSNMLSLDYIHRIDGKVPINNYLAPCVLNLKNFLGKRVLSDDKFSIAMTLFIVAISPSPISDKNPEEILSANKEEVIDALITTYFKDLNTEEDVERVRNLLQILLAKSDYREIINYIGDDANFIKKVALDKEINLKTIKNALHKQLISIHIANLKLNKNLSHIKNLAANITTMVGMIGLLGITVAAGGAIMPILVLPATIGVLKYLPQFGEKLGQGIVAWDKNIKIKEQELEIAKIDITNKLKIATKEIILEQNRPAIAKSPTSLEEIDISTVRERALTGKIKPIESSLDKLNRKKSLHKR
jgi:Uncharacterized RP853